MPAPQRLGILGGTFNPPHRGHVALARQARAQLGLDAVALVPSHTPPHKPAAPADPGPHHRLEMCRLAVADDADAGGAAGLRACGLEVDRGGVSYTVDTLLSLHALHPHTRPTLILGSDVARTLPGWHRAEEIPRLADVAVAARAGDSRRDVLDALAPLGADVAFLHLPPIPVSSSLVRERLAHGEPVDDFLGTMVTNYIARHRLYLTPAKTGAL